MSDTTATKGPRISRVAALDAAKAGGQTFRDGGDVRDCPYSTTGGVSERFNAHYWLKGFAAASSAE